jgi:hypothetical protein
MTPLFAKHFKVQEFVPEEVYRELGNMSMLLIDSRMVKTADAIREYFGVPMNINDWCFGGNIQYRGYRPLYSCVGAKWSQHKFGRALDIVSRIPASEIRKAILDNQEDFPFVSAMEDDVNWLHVDCRNIDYKNGIYLFKDKL